MRYNALGITCIIVALIGGIFIFKSKNNMPFDVIGLKKDQCEIMDNKRFNSVMVKKSIVKFISILIVGILFLITKKTIFFLAFPWIVGIISLVSSKKAEKYIKVK